MIYVDLDNTLIDSMRRWRMERDAAMLRGMSEETFARAMELLVESHGLSDFSFEPFFEVCKRLHPDLDPLLLSEWRALLELRVFFPDSLRFLEAFQKNELTLLTTGSVKHQQVKVRAHALEEYFGDILIVPTPKARAIASPPPDSIYVDDSGREIDEMKTCHPHVYCILVREPACWEKQKHSVRADARAVDLDHALLLIKQLQKT